MKWFDRKPGLSLFLSILGFALLPACLFIAKGQITESQDNASQLHLSSVSGASGERVTIPITLTNASPAKAVQFDLEFDHEMLRFDYIAAYEPHTTLITLFSQIDETTHRLILYFDDESVLPVDAGQLAKMYFTLSGPADISITLTPRDILLSDPSGSPLPITGGACSISIETPQAAPELHLALLCNRGQKRSLQIFLSSNQYLSQPPDLVAGSTPITMTLRNPGENLWSGRCYIPADTPALEVTASGTNGITTGTTSGSISIGELTP